jgi:hypothetical protein
MTVETMATVETIQPQETRETVRSHQDFILLGLPTTKKLKIDSIMIITPYLAYQPTPKNVLCCFFLATAKAKFDCEDNFGEVLVQYGEEFCIVTIGCGCLWLPWYYIGHVTIIIKINPPIYPSNIKSNWCGLKTWDTIETITVGTIGD